MDPARRFFDALSRSWFCQATSAELAAARILVAVNALWLVLSRPDLPWATSLPSPFWQHVTMAERVRFLAFPFPAPVEWALYIALIAALLLVAAGRSVAVSAIAAAILLYRFAALEPLLSSTGLLWFQCFTHPILFLLIIGGASGRHRTSFDDRWAVATMRALFALYYFFCGFEKLTVVGPRWVSASNIRALLQVQEARGIFFTPLAAPLASSEWACRAIAVATIALELTFPLVLFSSRLRRILVPAAFAGHIGIALALGLLFLNWPLLLLFADFRMAPVVWHQLRSRSAGRDGRRPHGLAPS